MPPSESPPIRRIRRELKQNADPRTGASGQGFFKEQVKLHGVRTATVTRIARSSFADLPDKGKASVFGLCEELWQSGYLEESFVACNWSYYVRQQYQPGDLAIFEGWLSRYVSNWASCDTLCNHTIGAFLDMYPDRLPALRQWARSENRWMRRASAVSLIIPAREGRFLEHVLGIAEILLLDSDDLVQKGYGWMLKAASEAHREEVFAWVMAHREAMPRTALRYAIEKMPGDMRHQAMAKPGRRVQRGRPSAAPRHSRPSAAPRHSRPSAAPGRSSPGD